MTTECLIEIGDSHNTKKISWLIRNGEYNGFYLRSYCKRVVEYVRVEDKRTETLVQIDHGPGITDIFNIESDNLNLQNQEEEPFIIPRGQSITLTRKPHKANLTDVCKAQIKNI